VMIFFYLVLVLFCFLILENSRTEVEGRSCAFVIFSVLYGSCFFLPPRLFSDTYTPFLSLRPSPDADTNIIKLIIINN
jgi:hypothetical protein